MNSLRIMWSRGFKCGKSTLGTSLTASVIACAHRGRITVAPKDAALVRAMHRMIKGPEDIGAQDVVRIPFERGTTGAKTVPGARGDYMEEARRRAVDS
jgi:uncharacterized protein YbjQ (UPF0145 family)